MLTQNRFLSMRSLMFRLFNICAFLLFPVIDILAQDDFVPGYIVTAGHDTLYGLVDLQPDSKNALHCNFKTSEQGLIQSFSPAGLNAYRFTDGKFYVSREVIINGVSKRIFLEYLVDGVADLFYYCDEDKDYYFIEKDSTGLVELTKETVAVTTHDQKDQHRPYDVVSQVESDKYKGVLRYFYQDDPDLMKQIDYGQFGNRSLIKITTSYHNHICPDEKCIVYEKNFKRLLFVGPKVGLRYSFLNFTFTDDYATTASFEGGIQLRYAPKFLHYRWNVLVDLMFNQIEYDENYTDNRPSGAIYSYDVYLKSIMMRIPFKVEYTLPGRIVKPTFSLGYDNIFPINADYSIFSNYYLPAHLYPYCWGLIFGTGIKTDISRKLQLFLQAEYEYQSNFYQLKSSVDINCWNMHSIFLGIGIDYCLY